MSWKVPKHNSSDGILEFFGNIMTCTSALTKKPALIFSLKLSRTQRFRRFRPTAFATFLLTEMPKRNPRSKSGSLSFRTRYWIWMRGWGRSRWPSDLRWKKSAFFRRDWILFATDFNNKTLAAFCTTSTQYFLPVLCRHASAETVRCFSSFAARLECSFHLLNSR